MRHPNDEGGRETLGYLGSNGVLYCSQACASRAGSPEAAAVDQDDYDALNDAGARPAGGLCPVCGNEFIAEWPEAPVR